MNLATRDHTSAQPSVLIFLGDPSRLPQKELAGIIGLRTHQHAGITTVITSNVHEIEGLLKANHFKILIWFYHSETQPKLESILQKSRNFSQMRDLQILTLFESSESPEPQVLESVLRCGAFWVYQDSAKLDSWLKQLQQILFKSSDVSVYPNLTPTLPTPIAIESFCRIGRITFAPHRAVTVETNLMTRPGDSILLKGSFENSLPGIRPSFKVNQVSHDNLYYRYVNRVELEPAFDWTPELWTQFATLHQSDWSAPKTKLLWLTSDHSLRKELAFDKSLFSVYVEDPRSLSFATIQRLSPRIICIDQSAPDTYGLITKWIHSFPQEARDDLPLVIQSPSQSPSPSSLAASSSLGPVIPLSLRLFDGSYLTSEATEILRSTIKSRLTKSVQGSKFIARQSSLSRAYVSLNGMLHGISTRQFTWISSHDFIPPTLVRMNFHSAQLRGPHPVYGRVVHTEALPDQNHFKVTCDWIPGNVQISDIVPHYKSLIKK